MRKILLLLAVGGAAITASVGAKAVPATLPGPAPVVSASAQEVQYDWRREHWRREHWRHERWRRWHRWHHY
jgi:hypothetical protein